MALAKALDKVVIPLRETECLFESPHSNEDSDDERELLARMTRAKNLRALATSGAIASKVECDGDHSDTSDASIKVTSYTIQMISVILALTMLMKVLMKFLTLMAIIAMVATILAPKIARMTRRKSSGESEGEEEESSEEEISGDSSNDGEASE